MQLAVKLFKYNDIQNIYKQYLHCRNTMLVGWPVTKVATLNLNFVETKRQKLRQRLLGMMFLP